MGKKNSTNDRAGEICHCGWISADSSDLCCIAEWIIFGLVCWLCWSFGHSLPFLVRVLVWLQSQLPQSSALYDQVTCGHSHLSFQASVVSADLAQTLLSRVNKTAKLRVLRARRARSLCWRFSMEEHSCCDKRIGRLSWALISQRIEFLPCMPTSKMPRITQPSSWVLRCQSAIPCKLSYTSYAIRLISTQHGLLFPDMQAILELCGVWTIWTCNLWDALSGLSSDALVLKRAIAVQGVADRQSLCAIRWTRPQSR